MPSDHWLETYRGTVFRWEVDSNDHLTVAYYLARFDDAAATALHALGLEPAVTTDCFIHYSHELRVGDPHARHQRRDRRRARGARARPPARRVHRRARCAPPSSTGWR